MGSMMQNMSTYRLRWLEEVGELLLLQKWEKNVKHDDPWWCFLSSPISLTDISLDKIHVAAFSHMIFSWCIFVNEKFCILIKTSLKFVPKGPIGNGPALI